MNSDPSVEDHVYYYFYGQMRFCFSSLILLVTVSMLASFPDPSVFSIINATEWKDAEVSNTDNLLLRAFTNPHCEWRCAEQLSCV